MKNNFSRPFLALPLVSSLLVSGIALAHQLNQKSMGELKKQTAYFKHAQSKAADTSARVKIGQKLPNFAIADISDRGYTASSFRGKMTLFVLADTQCPCVEAIEMRLKALGKKYGKAGLRPVYVFPKYGENALQIARFMSGHQIPFPALHDKKQTLLKILDGQCSSEVYLFDQAGILRYHGRVDDNTFSPESVKSHDLENAISAVVAGKKVAKPEVPAMGCAIQRI